GGVLLPPRGARAARRRVPHPVPRVPPRARLPPERRPRPRRRRPRARALTHPRGAPFVPKLEQFRLPDAGEGLTEAEIVAWHVNPGDRVETNQVLVEIETAKSLVDLPCPWDGVVREVLVPVGTTVDVGTPIITIETEGEDGADDGGPGAASADDGGSDSAPAGDGGSGSAPADDGGSGAAAADDGGSGAVLVGYGTTEHVSRRRRRTAPAQPGTT